MVPTAAPSSFRPSEFSFPVAGALQAHEHETSRVVMLIDTTSGQLIADLIAIGRRQMLVPHEHPPDPRPEFLQTCWNLPIISACESRQSHGQWIVTGRIFRTLLASCRRAVAQKATRSQIRLLCGRKNCCVCPRRTRKHAFGDVTEPDCRKESIDVNKRRHIVRTGSCCSFACKKLPHEDFGSQHVDASAIENVHSPAPS